MAVRSTMSYLISKVRSNIGDTAGAMQVFSDQEIQDTLDSRRKDVYDYALSESPNELDYFAEHGWWEASPTITLSDDSVVTSVSTPVFIASENLVAGQWTLNTTPNSTVRLSGKRYDVNGASADLLDAWMGKVKLEFDFLELGSTFKASQQIVMLEVAAKRFRARQWISSSPTRRSDEYAGWYS
jgi:hypothetical protein